MVGLPEGMATLVPTSFRYEVEPVAGRRLGKARDGPVVRRWLEWNELMWRPQRDSNPCLSLERANQPKSEPTQNQRFTNTTNNLDPIQLSLDLTPDHDTET